MKFGVDHSWMTRSRVLHVAFVLPALLCTFYSTQANSETRDVVANIYRSTTVVKTSDLEFGTFIPGTTTSIFRINPKNDKMSKRRGNAIAVGGAPSAASFEVTGTARKRVQITRGQNRIFITRDGGTETMRVNRFSYDRRRRKLNATGNASFKVGGQLRIRPNQAPGNYSGVFDVIIEYQ